MNVKEFDLMKKERVPLHHKSGSQVAGRTLYYLWNYLTKWEKKIPYESAMAFLGKLFQEGNYTGLEKQIWILQRKASYAKNPIIHLG